MPTFSSALDRTLDAKVVTLGKIRPTSRRSASNTSRATRRQTLPATSNIPTSIRSIEMTDMREAQRSYEANLNIISATRRMIQRTLDILKA